MQNCNHTAQISEKFLSQYHLTVIVLSCIDNSQQQFYQEFYLHSIQSRP